MITDREDILELHTYGEVTSHARIINDNQIEEWLWFHIPVDVSRNYEFTNVYELLPESAEKDHGGKIFRQGRHPWLAVHTSFLDLGIGYHLYKLRFLDPDTNDVVLLYVAYQIQSNNPEKPYIYMDRTSEGSPCQ